MPVVVHPNEQYLANKPPKRNVDYRAITASGAFGLLLHQPTAEVLKAWNVLDRGNPEATATDMLKAQRHKGFGGVALDLYHLAARRGEEAPLELDWCERFVGSLAAEGALGSDSEVQLSFRPDFGDDRKHLYDAVQGGLRSTPQGILLEAVREALPAGQDSLRLTMEIPPSAFQQLHDMPAALGNRIITEEARLLMAS